MNAENHNSSGEMAGNSLSTLRLASAAPAFRGAYVSLDPLRMSDAPGLFLAAQSAPIWRYLPVPMPEALLDMERIIEKALMAAAAGNELPFVIRSATTGEIVGSTRYLDIQRENRSLEIGWTWLTPEVQRSAINSETKFLLLKHAFEELDCVRVQIKTDGRNAQSQAAIERLGAVREGVLRQHRIMHDGYKRDTVMYSIVSEEWPAVKLGLQERMASYLRRTLKAGIEKICIFPIKSLDGIAIPEGVVGPAGGLQWDRSWRIVDAQNHEVLNAKRVSALQGICAEFGLSDSGITVSLSIRDVDRTDQMADVRAHIPGEENVLAQWLSRFLGREVRLEFSEQGFPDDTEARGPTIISGETISEMARQLSLPVEEIRRRFRSNIELAGVGLKPFWEDALFGRAGTSVHFQIGEVEFSGTNPCQRCAVPARDSLTGESDKGFQRQFAELRRQLLPAWACEERFDHYYRLAVNTRIDSAEVGKKIGTGALLSF